MEDTYRRWWQWRKGRAETDLLQSNTAASD
jgi:hypothetical protein